MKPSETQHKSALFIRLIRGDFGLALTYWLLFLLMSAAFFVLGSAAVAEENWSLYVNLLVALIGWTFLLLIGVKRGFKGQDPGKALGRIAMLFLLLVMTNALATLSFI